MGMGANENSPHGNGNKSKKWEWGWEGMGIKPLYKQLETGHLVSGGGVTGQRARSTVTTPQPARSRLET